ncbi:hypothetical protein D3C79_1013740 [compost metagenome]
MLPHDLTADLQRGGCRRGGRIANMQRAAAFHKMEVVHQFAVGGQGLSTNAGRTGLNVFRLQFGDQPTRIFGKALP